MDASRKRALAGSTSAEDRLSALPDALIHTIMSSLKAHQVVQTSVLAKRWRHLWRSVPNLDIDLPEFINDHDLAAIQARYAKFVDFADYLLFHRHQDGTLLDTFRLHTNTQRTMVAQVADVGRWVRRGLKCSPRVFYFQNDHVYGSHVPQIPLELWSGPPGSCRLTKLHLVGLSLRCSFAEQISSVCDVLEELELRSCQIAFQKITSPSLKSLIIDRCDADYYRGEPNKQLIITAPHLASLRLKLARPAFVVLLNEMASLVKASIHDCISYDVSIYDNQCKFLSSLSNVTNLELLGFHKRLLPDEEPVEFPMFKNLTTLLLDHCELGDKFRLLRHFLQDSPNLERLIVKLCQPKVLKRFQERERKG